MIKKLREILKGVKLIKIIGKKNDYNKILKGIFIHSDKVFSNTMYVAKKGGKTDGHFFIKKAINKGASVILCEDTPSIIKDDITYLIVQDSVKELGIISSNFYENPTKKIKLIGITGTNGKTSVTNMLHQLFSLIGEKSMVISTIGIKILSKEYPNNYTTPNIIDINKYLYISVNKGCKYAFIEVSSHGIKQGRIHNLLFTGGIFTNITHDHLDYHKSIHNYLYVKKSFFEKMQKKSFSLINKDDKNYRKIIKNISYNLFFFGLKKKNIDFSAKIIKKNFTGTELIINNSYKIYVRILGEFNVYNLLAVYSTSILLNINKDKVLKNLSKINPIKGRFEQFISDLGIRIIVDYAHNPDGLISILKAIKDIKKESISKNYNLICIIGCGGDRDRKKRPLMGKIVYETCDISIFTSDNPRNENPKKILSDMIRNIPKTKKRIFNIVDRKKAIKFGVKIAKNKDIILILGKGHEKYQEIKNKRYPFDDMKIAKFFLKEKKKYKLPFS